MPNKFETLLVEIDAGIVTIKVNRPSKLNALNEQVLLELKDILRHLKENAFKEKIAGAVLTGEGEKAFIAGADIAAMQNMDIEAAKAFGNLGQEVSLLLEEIPIPVIAAVNGFALGGGCEMALACDFILAVPQAVFGQPEVKLGIIPGFGGTQRLAKVIGSARAREWCYSGRNVKAQEAKEAGLIMELCQDIPGMLARARELIQSFAQNAPLAVAKCKLAINEGVDLPTPHGLKVELNQFAEIFSSHDRKEGISAFLEKRKATFQAR